MYITFFTSTDCILFHNYSKIFPEGIRHVRGCTVYTCTCIYVLVLLYKYIILYFCLCRFAHFFASPLLLESSLSREIEAVDSGKGVIYEIHNIITI